jgi:hypothetical protein
MSKMSELSLAVSELKRCGDALIGIADSLAGLFSGEDEHTTTNQEITESNTAPAKLITLEAVRAILAEKSRDGYTAEVRELLNKHGAEKLSEIKLTEYPALLAAAEVLGNE